ncbi:uncharacterized protein LOC126725216 isoform X2 [Quercus robur]|nr:uncharacterized protein LOC126725216 isoform X2 [Quercus robur]
MGIEGCRGIRSIKFFSVPTVKEIIVGNNFDMERLELEASNLHSLYIIEWKLQCNLNLLPFKNLKNLSLGTPNVTEKWLEEHLSGLPLLENLHLLSCSKLERINISSHHHLKSLKLVLCANLVELMIDNPKLCRLSYWGKTAISFSLNALGLLEAEYTLWPRYGTWDAEKIEFLSKMRNSKVFKLKIFYDQDVIIPEELRVTLSSPLYNVKHLKLIICPPFTGYEISELLDSFLWISPLPELLVIESNRHKSDPDFDKLTFELSYEKPIYKGENPSCCKFLPFPCWRHCLKTVKIDSLKGYGDEELLYKYFSENAKTLEDFQFHVGGIA